MNFDGLTQSPGQLSLQDADKGHFTGRVIWITGYSSAGKTTVGRRVEAELRRRHYSTVFLDGDDLRSIFSGRWGYEREDRVELARVYFRMCSHLASQGHIVVIAADWLRENVPGVLEVYLDVPEAERRLRDSAGKNVYAKVGDMSAMYDGPGETALRLENHGAATPEDMMQEILAAFDALPTSSASYGRQDHWRDYYSKAKVPVNPSPFAREVGSQLGPNLRLLEVGCGNGRDAAYFWSQGHRVVALDASKAAVELAGTAHGETNIDWRHGSLPSVASDLGGGFDAIYSRFVLHAMPLQEEEQLLDVAHGLLQPGGRLYVECRSINDPMARLGEVISPTERIHGHYRRFIVKDELVERLTSRGFEIESVIESNGLATHGNEDPVVVRIIAGKKATA
jgi:bifunctional enzyme CysN/CysC